MMDRVSALMARRAILRAVYQEVMEPPVRTQQRQPLQLVGADLPCKKNAVSESRKKSPPASTDGHISLSECLRTWGSSPRTPSLRSQTTYLEGYVTVIHKNGWVGFLLWGPNTSKWLQLSYDYDSKASVKTWTENRWYVVERIHEGITYNERGRFISGPKRSDDGDLQVELFFADNGYSDWVPICSVFEIENYDEIDRLPDQAASFFVVGVTNVRCSIRDLELLEDRWRGRRVSIAVVGTTLYEGNKVEAAVVCDHRGEPLSLTRSVCQPRLN